MEELNYKPEKAYEVATLIYSDIQHRGAGLAQSV
jgi:hypothetical protein